MTNSKGRCAACRQYFPRAELTIVGLSGVCGEACRRTLLDKHKAKVARKEVAHQRRNTKPRVPGSVRVAVKRRDKNVCRFCSQTGYRKEVHHILYRSQGGPDRATNLILLCDAHHQVVHSSKRHWQPTLLAVIWAHYVEGAFYTIPQMEKRLIKEGLLEPLRDQRR